MGTDEIFSPKHDQLLSKVSDLYVYWKLRNDNKKSNYVPIESLKFGLFAVIGGVIGGLVGGPPGAVLGATLGGAGSATKSAYSSDGHDKASSCVYYPL